ncbi:biotin/lipoyl-binding protein [Nannocystis bainbridge]|uniref:HlyD family efflux transporter periplasmic adaptor subunit n=1 Tax=Nannocystis bainbridge TaxID=2995303 RepID=A0ABT5DSX5_9BACT|nr:HlyD family efflux transporter periplasmic adaptor subunit [Nannocystis bainbridge]MDC0716740.1 HlyD family efflux transporter periplasmic adaptor subunit [Nannocystis bainbridge]
MSEPRNHEADQAARRVVFRDAALAAHRGASRPGHPLHIVPTWTRWAVTVTLLLVGAGLVFAATVRVGEYAEGRAVVRREGRLVVTTSASGTVQSIPVRLGQRVEAGEVLVRLDDASQRAELARVEREYEQRLVELLRAPADDTRRERLAALDGQLQLARARAAERSVVAPEPGVVSDVRVRPGQALAPGDAVVAVEQDAAQTVVVGLFPGHYRPLLGAADTRLSLALEGFPDSRQDVVVRTVADEVVGPAEAMRYLGRDREGALDLSGPVVVVVTVLPADTFVADGTEYRVYDGMQGTLEAKVRSATLLETLVPALQQL